MWLKVIVSHLKAAAGQKPIGAEVFCTFSVNESPCQVQDQSLTPFCWPLGPENQRPKEFMAPEEFTFTLTQGDGSRLQGFCRRFLPPAPRVGSRLRYPQVLCLVCEASWSALFFKVLEVTEQLLRQTDILSDVSHQQLPADSLAGTFLSNLGSVLAQQPELGSVIRVALPHISIPLAMSPSKRIAGSSCEEPLPLLLTEEFIELQVPPDAGTGAANAGVSLARLLWHVPVPAMVTLIASLLLERRVLVVGQSRDMVSAAVCAAQALLHPFRWHHIYLPLLPWSLADYLTAPMPFLIGLPAQLLPAIKNLPMDEITLIDLDLGKCEPSPGSARDDAQLLPWREQLESALHAAFSMLKSPTEHESNPVIAGIMHGYLLKLLGTYRSHIYPDGTGPGCSPPPPASPQTNGISQLPPSSSRQGGPGHHRSRSASPLHGGGSSSSSLVAFAAAALGGNSSEPQRSPRGTNSQGGAVSARHSRHSSSNISRADEGMKAHGYWFDHVGLVAAHRRNDKARNFLTLLRQSQLFEVFVRERLAMCANVEGGPELSGDPFEQLVNAYLDNRSRRLSARLGAGVRSSLSRFGALIMKHRRTDSTQSLSGFGLPGAASSSGGLGSDVNSSSGGLMSRPKGAGGLSASFADRPETLKMRQMVASFAAAAEQMRRNLTTSGNRAGLHSSSSSLEAFSDKVLSVFDPSSLFDDGDEDLDAEAAAAEAAASSSGRLSRNSMSSNSLKDLGAGPLVAPSGASWTAGATSSSRTGPLSTQSVHGGFAGPSSSTNCGMQHGGLAGSNVNRGSPPLGRRSVPVISMSPRTERPPSPAPLIELDGSSSSSGSPTAAGSGLPPAAPAVQALPGTRTTTSSTAGAVQQQQQLPHHRYLEQLQVPNQQQQQQQQQQSLLHSPTSPRDLQAHWQQQHSPRSTRESLVQQFMRPAVNTSSGSTRGQPQQHHQPQHIDVKAALAAIAPGPLPQPPPPRTRSVTGSHILEAAPGQHPHMQPLRQGLANLSHVQQQRQQQQQLGSLHGGSMPATVSALHAVTPMFGGGAGGGAGGAPVSSSVTQPAEMSGASWDPFAELLNERVVSFSGQATPWAVQQQQQVLQPPESLVLQAKGCSADSDGGASAADSLGGFAPTRVAVCGNGSSSASSSSDGGSARPAFSTSTTPAGPAVGTSASLGVMDTVTDNARQQVHTEQQQQPSSLSLQQQPTMPEAWLSALADLSVDDAAAAGPCQASQGSCISLNGGRRLEGTAGAGGAEAHLGEDLGLSGLKQAFAQQLRITHSSSAGDDLL